MLGRPLLALRTESTAWTAWTGSASTGSVWQTHFSFPCWNFCRCNKVDGNQQYGGLEERRGDQRYRQLAGWVWNSFNFILSAPNSLPLLVGKLQSNRVFSQQLCFRCLQQGALRHMDHVFVHRSACRQLLQRGSGGQLQRVLCGEGRCGRTGVFLSARCQCSGHSH